MRILILEDCEERILLFDELTETLDVEKHWCTNPTFVSDEEYKKADLIMLDHDMCIRYETGHGEMCITRGTYSGCSCPNGTDALAKIFSLDLWVPFIVHSQNTIRGPEMHRRLLEREKDSYFLVFNNWFYPHAVSPIWQPRKRGEVAEPNQLKALLMKLGAKEK